LRGQKYTKYNKMNNNSENFRGGKIAATGLSSLVAGLRNTLAALLTKITKFKVKNRR